MPMANSTADRTAWFRGMIKSTEGDRMKLYKILDKNGFSCNGGSDKWYLPKDGRPGRWMPKLKGELISCEWGYHLCRVEDLVFWLNDTIYEAEYRGEIIIADHKVIVREARLLRKIEAWNDITERLFGCDCAEHVLPIYEHRYTEDDRPRKAIEIARSYALGKSNKKALAAAWNAARDATRASACAAAWAAACAAAWAATESATRDATESATNAARAAAESAAERAAAWAAAWEARVATWDAWAAARDAECQWQTQRLIELLGLEE